MNRIEEIKKRLEATTPGPWYFVFSDCNQSCELRGGKGENLIEIKYKAIHIRDRDADFISHAPEDMQFLLDELEAANKIIAMIDEGFTEYMKYN